MKIRPYVVLHMPNGRSVESRPTEHCCSAANARSIAAQSSSSRMGRRGANMSVASTALGARNPSMQCEAVQQVPGSGLEMGNGPGGLVG